MALSCLLCYAVTVYTVIMIVRIILSWATMVWSPPHSLTPAIRLLYDVTEPVLSMFRRYIPPIGMLDISPIVVFILLGVIRSFTCVGCG
jgi:YggT family protein